MPIEQRKAFVPDKYPACVSWSDFQKIAAMLREIHSDGIRRQTRGVPRDGKALLRGIVYCGQETKGSVPPYVLAVKNDPADDWKSVAVERHCRDEY